jgi:shikimate dehydrogenase
MTSTSTKLNLIFGHPVAHSLSPKLHSSIYESIGIADKYTFLASDVHPDDLDKAMCAMKILGINGLAVTIPHKVAIIDYLDDVDSTAMAIGAVNTVVNKNGILHGYNTDWLGTLIPLANYFGVTIKNLHHIPRFLEGKKVALIGAGGASRAMAFAVLSAGAELFIFNRTKETAQILAEDLKEVMPLAMIQVFDNKLINSVYACDIVINSTSLGMTPHAEETPVPKQWLHSGQICFDAVYKPFETRFIREAKEQGCETILGLEMFLYQAVYQFEYHTGHKPDIAKMREILSV